MFFLRYENPPSYQILISIAPYRYIGISASHHSFGLNFKQLQNVFLFYALRV